MDNILRGNWSYAIIGDKDDLHVFAMIDVGQEGIDIEVFGLLGEEMEDYRVKVELGEDLVTAVLSISSWSEFLEQTEKRVVREEWWTPLKYWFRFPDLFTSDSDTIEINLVLERKTG